MEKQCIDASLSLDYPNHEVIVLPDLTGDESLTDKIRIIVTGPVLPSVKRNSGLKHSKHDLIAFVDSDAFPETTWLKNAVPHFLDESVGLVGPRSARPQPQTSPLPTLVPRAPGRAAPARLTQPAPVRAPGQNICLREANFRSDLLLRLSAIFNLCCQILCYCEFSHCLPPTAKLLNLKLLELRFQLLDVIVSDYLIHNSVLTN